MFQAKAFPLLLVTVIAVGIFLPGIAPAQDAQDVFTAVGIRHGLCVHLGCGREKSPGLTAALAAGSKMLVHGVAVDDAAAERARAIVEEKGLLGQAIVERLPLDPLPHVRDLANLVVIEDIEALTAHGLKLSEADRILAPGGALCVYKDGRWTTTIKPRPKEMDDWTHPMHGPDGNRVSGDRLARFPVGLRWQDGVPMNFNLWAACRGWVVAGGRVFTLSTTELENLAVASISQHKKEEYVTARDAFNGLPLWKVNCKTTNNGAYLNAWNPAPLVTDGRRVYAYADDRLVGLDAATGQVAKAYPVKYPSARLMLADGVLVSAGWEAKEESKDPGPQTLWAPWVAKKQVGAVEAFDSADGKARWSLADAAQELLASDGTAYLLLQKGNPSTQQEVVAVDLQTGRQRWRAPHTSFGPEPGLHLCCAGQGVLVLARVRAKAISVLSAADGKVLWEIKPANQFWTPIVDGLIWCGDRKYEPKTGQLKGKLATSISSPVCTPAAVVGNYVTASRGCGYLELPPEDDPQAKTANRIMYTGARGGCIEGMVPACGMFLTSQNNCRCAPGQVPGFLAIGPCGEPPAAADFEQARPLEKGPALETPRATGGSEGDWPMFRHDAARSGATKARLPKQLNVRWQTDVARPAAGPLAEAWKARLTACLTALVAARGMVFAAALDAGQIIALDATSGKVAWRYTAGGRIDTPPTIHQGLCLFGCHDGWVYALSAQDGKLAWRLRAAPWERRMVAFGQIESVWPAIGTVLVHNDMIYATAGRATGSDGGIALCALEPQTGRQIWAGQVTLAAPRVNDMLAVADGKIAMHQLRVDPKTGKQETPPGIRSEALDGTMDGGWTRLGNRRSGNLTIGRAKAEMFAWTESMIFGYEASGKAYYAVAREKTAMPPKPAEPPKTPEEKRAAAELEKLNRNDYTWRESMPADHQAEAMALTDGALVLSGRSWDTKTGAVGGFLWLVNPQSGKRTFEQSLDAPPTYQGLAVANGRAYVTLQNGRVVCFGE